MAPDHGVFYATGEFPLCGAVGMARWRSPARNHR